MSEHISNENGDAGWEDDGGARLTEPASAPDERRRSEQKHLDASHESDSRGEHRYDGAHQTSAEQRARQERDDLKRRLSGHGGRRAG